MNYHNYHWKFLTCTIILQNIVRLTHPVYTNVLNLTCTGTVQNAYWCRDAIAPLLTTSQLLMLFIPFVLMCFRCLGITFFIKPQFLNVIPIPFIFHTIGMLAESQQFFLSIFYTSRYNSMNSVFVH